MSHERKPLWPWIVALLIVVPVVYVASFGPACWISSQRNSGFVVVNVIYQPLMRAWWRGHPCNNDLLQKFAKFKARPYSFVTRDYSGEYRWADWSGLIKGGRP